MSADPGIATALSVGAQRVVADESAIAPVSAAISELALDLYKALAAEEDNFIFSPYSISVALAMARNGARGDTASEMDAVLHFTDLGLDGVNEGFNALEQILATRAGEKRTRGDMATVEFATANALWMQVEFAFRTSFIEVLESFYGAGPYVVDYKNALEEARSIDWVEEQTNQIQVIPMGAHGARPS